VLSGRAREKGRATVDVDNEDVKLQKQLEVAADALSKEFADRLASEDVDRCFAEELAPFTEARVRQFVPILAERRTRSRLRALAATR
jgi:Protein of unknown function (DUF3562)